MTATAAIVARTLCIGFIEYILHMTADSQGPPYISLTSSEIQQHMYRERSQCRRGKKRVAGSKRRVRLPLRSRRGGAAQTRDATRSIRNARTGRQDVEVEQDRRRAGAARMREPVRDAPDEPVARLILEGHVVRVRPGNGHGNHRAARIGNQMIEPEEALPADASRT